MGRKSKAAIQREQEDVVAIVRQHPEGANYSLLIEDFGKRTGRKIKYLTLRRRLDELETKGAIERKDARRRLPLYRPKDGSDERQTKGTEGYSQGEAPEDPSFSMSKPSAAIRSEDTDIPLSSKAKLSRKLLHRPRAFRPPVAYDPGFLEAYTPGSDWYLPIELRTRLSVLGTTAYANQAAGTYARDIMQRLIIDLSWGSSRLEGNKYSRIETEELLQEGREVSGASDQDRQMILNHKAAIEFLVENAEDIAFNRYTVLGLHALLSENLLPDPDDEGRLRTRAITIGTSVYTPTVIPQVIEQQFDTILTTAAAIPDPLEQSFFMMVHLPYLQPFIDVNKRTSRLAANIPLIRANLCPLSFVDVPEQTYTDGTLTIYEQKDVALLRDVFVWAYERSCAQFKVLRQAMGEPDPIRLNYRTQLRALIAEIVKDRAWPSDEALQERAALHRIPDADRSAFLTAARNDLRRLRPEILARYQLRQSEFDAWLAVVREAR